MLVKFRLRSLLMSVIVIIGLLALATPFAYASDSMKTSEKCIKLIKEFEGFAQKPFFDYSQWSVGYGTACDEDDYPNGITEEEANKKRELIDWCLKNKKILEHHFLCGTGTTAKMVAEHTGLPVRGFNSGPLGGDQQIGARIVEGRVDVVIFFSDPLTAQPHDPDVKALLRIAQVYDIPIANNRATADFIMASPYMSGSYEHELPDFVAAVKERAKNL